MSRLFKNTTASKLKPELMAALFSPEESRRPQDFLRELDRYGITYSLSKTIFIPRVELHGGYAEDLKKCCAVLAANPEIEAWIILNEATKSDTLLDVIQERASKRWCEGLSDSLYMAVLGNFSSTGETVEYTDKPDMEMVKFKRSLGISEAAIMDKERSPSVWIKLKPKTDWDAELEKYR